MEVASKAPVKAGKESGVRVPRMVMFSDRHSPGENKRDVYDFMRFRQLAQTDSLFQFFDLSWMNDSLLIG